VSRRAPFFVGFCQFFVSFGFRQFLVSSGCSTVPGVLFTLFTAPPPDRHLVPASPPPPECLSPARVCTLTIIIIKLVYLHLASSHYSSQNDLTKHGCSKHFSTPGFHRSQYLTYGPAGREHLRHRSSGTSTREAGVRAHPTGTASTNSHCALHAARSPTTSAGSSGRTRATPTHTRRIFR